MSAGDVAAVAVAVAVVILVVGALFALASLTATLRSVRLAVEELQRQSVPLLTDLRATLDRANGELARVDDLLGTAESVGSTVDSASRLAYMAFSNPLIKLLAFGAGASRAARGLRRRGRRGAS